jgi:hypothetical protein
MFNLIDSFYDQNELGLIIVNLMNMHFNSTHQPQKKYFGGDRMLAYPVHETDSFSYDGPMCAYDIFIKTFTKKTNIKPLHVETFLEKQNCLNVKNPLRGNNINNIKIVLILI